MNHTMNYIINLLIILNYIPFLTRSNVDYLPMRSTVKCVCLHIFLHFCTFARAEFKRCFFFPYTW